MYGFINFDEPGKLHESGFRELAQRGVDSLQGLGRGVLKVVACQHLDDHPYPNGHTGQDSNVESPETITTRYPNLPDTRD